MRNVGDGQLATSSTAIYTNPAPIGTPAIQSTVFFANTSSSLTETITITVTMASGNTRRWGHFQLAPNEQAILSGVPLASADILKGSTSDATTVDYTVLASQLQNQDIPVSLVVLDTNGNVKTAGQINSGNVTITGFLFESATNNITAHSGGGQGSAVALTTEINRVSTVAAPGDSVVLPASVAGLTIVVINTGANPCAVFPNGSDTINGGSASASVTQMPSSVCIYVCPIAGTWQVEGIGGGYSGSLPTLSFTDSITAHSGGTQASAVALTSAFSRVTTVAAQGDSVKLPASAPGLAITVDNRGANSMQVFGAGSDTINGILTTTGIAQPVNAVWTYFCNAAGNWDVQPSLSAQPGLVSLTGATDAIPPHVSHTYVINKAGVDAMTLAAPTSTTDDGLIITITSNTANAHTLTATGLLQTGTASVNVATFAAQKGAGLQIMAYQGKWNVISSVGITFS